MQTSSRDPTAHEISRVIICANFVTLHVTFERESCSKMIQHLCHHIYFRTRTIQELFCSHWGSLPLSPNWRGKGKGLKGKAEGRRSQWTRTEGKRASRNVPSVRNSIEVDPVYQQLDPTVARTWCRRCGRWSGWQLMKASESSLLLYVSATSSFSFYTPSHQVIYRFMVCLFSLIFTDVFYSSLCIVVGWTDITKTSDNYSNVLHKQNSLYHTRSVTIYLEWTNSFACEMFYHVSQKNCTTLFLQ